MIYCDDCKYFDECPILNIGDFCGLEYFEPLPQFIGTTLANGSSDEAKSE